MGPAEGLRGMAYSAVQSAASMLAANAVALPRASTWSRRAPV